VRPGNVPEELSRPAVQIEWQEGPPLCLEGMAGRLQQVKAMTPLAECAPGKSEGLGMSWDLEELGQLVLEGQGGGMHRGDGRVYLGRGQSSLRVAPCASGE
jgi:hypothetical protein